MSRLKLYWPENDQAETTTYPSRFSEDVSGDNMVIPMRNFRADHASSPATGSSMMSVLVRAQVIRENCQCPSCGHPVVEPVELNNAAPSKNGLPIPGTATLVGFHCCGCEQEWSV
ncbi:MAG: hypothetical protein P8M30_08170 [Planctomycetaceae bacterium]|jgi:hypothetical protein|nr:hypothetical protein [Planctomycetaceae bacterium]MDC0307702.1 hypothetical protein [Planctomycetaceae bacterium]MDG2389282.1 hypothetical protein [Planctomycetaceae bacterium]